MLFLGVYILSCVLLGYRVEVFCGIHSFCLILTVLCKIKVNMTLKEIKVFLQVFCLKVFGMLVFIYIGLEP